MADTNTVTNSVTNVVNVTNVVTTTNDASARLLDAAKGHPLFNPSTPLGALVDGVIIIVIAWLAGRFLAFFINRVLNRPRRFHSDPTAIRFFGHLGRAGVYLFAFLTYANLVPALQGIGHAWLASVGLASVVVGLAAQNTLGNLVAGISLLLYRPFNLGDVVQVNVAGIAAETGTVESLDLGYTILRTPDNRRILIPNSVMISQTSINLTTSGSRLLATIPINVAPDTDIDRARTALADVVKQHPKSREYLGAPVTAVTNTSTTLSLKVWCDNFADLGEVRSDLLESIRKRFAAEKIELR